MKKSTLNWFAAMLIIAVMGIVYTNHAQKTPTAAPDAVIFSEDFESFEIGGEFPVSPWTNHNSSTAIWSIVNDGTKAAQQTFTGTTMISVGDTTWQNYKVSANVKMAALGTRGGVVARFTSTSSYYSLYVRTSTGGTKTLEINKRNAGGNNPLGNVTVPEVVIGEFYKLTLEVNGANIKGYLNDELKLEFTDADYPAGKIALYNIGDTTYDNILVEDDATLPPAPTGLSATAATGSIDLSWSAAVSAKGYNIKRSTTSGSGYTTIGTSSSTSFSDTDVAFGTTYYYVVSSTNSAGESGNSNEVSSSPLQAAPAAPSGLLNAAGNQVVRLFWTGSPDAASYNVKRGPTSSGPFENVATGVSDVSFVDTGVENGTTYYYRVSAVNQFGESANSGSTAATPRLGMAVSVTNQTELTAALNNAVAGDVITLADGNYSGFKTRRKFGTATQPIVIQSQNPLGAVFNAGQFELENTEWVTVKGFKFTLSNTVRFRNAIYCRLTENEFELDETGLSSLHWVIVSGSLSHHNRVDHNNFKNKSALGNFMNLSGDNGQVSQFDRIDHNLFYNIGPMAENGMETLRLGDSSVSQSSGFTVVEHNLFLECNGDPEVVSVKTSDNFIRYNTFRRSQGGLVARQGNRSELYGNYFIGEGAAGTSGIRAYGDDHKIYNNYFEGLTGTSALAPIAITNGDADDGHLPGANQSLHYRPRRITIVNNTLVNNASAIEIGGNYTLPPQDLVIANNLITADVGNIVRYRTEPINTTYNGNIGYTTGSATMGIEVTPAQISNVNSLLVTADGIQKLGEGSPAINASVGTYTYVIEDVEGQNRTGIKDVGADEFGPFESQRLPLNISNTGTLATDKSVSGHVTMADGSPLGDVNVNLSRIFTSLAPGTYQAAAKTDAHGYYTITDITATGNLVVFFEKPGFTFEPYFRSFSNLTEDEYFGSVATEEAIAPQANISGRVLSNGRPVAKATVVVTGTGGVSMRYLTGPMGYFSFENVATGQSYTVSVQSKGRVYADQQISHTNAVELTFDDSPSAGANK